MSSKAKFAREVGILMLGLLTTLICVFTPDSLAPVQADDLLDLEGEDVIRYNVNDDDVDVQDATRRIEVGRKIGDGCQFSTSFTKSANEAGRILTTLAANFETCEILIEEGTLSQAEVKKLTTTAPMTTSVPQAADIGPTGTIDVSSDWGAVASASNRITARWRTWYEDLVWLDLNWLDSEITYTKNPTTGTVTYISGVCAQWWRSGTGWSNGGGTCTHAPGPSNASHKVVADHDFHNDVFPCRASRPGINLDGRGADTHYRGNTITAYAAKDAVGATTDVWASGDCSYLLRRRQMLYN